MDEQAFHPQWQFKFQAHFVKWFGLPQCLKTNHLSLYNIKKDMLLTGPFATLSMPSFDFHLPPCMEGFLIHLSPLYGNCHCFPRWHNFPVVKDIPLWDVLLNIYQIASLKTTFSKKFQLMRRAHPPLTPQCVAQARWLTLPHWFDRRWCHSQLMPFNFNTGANYDELWQNKWQIMNL